MKERILTYLKEIALGEDEVKEKAENLVNTIIEKYSDFQLQTIDSFTSKILYSSAIEIGVQPDAEITTTYHNLIDISLSALFKDIGEKISILEIDNFLNFFKKDSGSFFWNPTTEIQKKFHSFLEKEGRCLEEIDFASLSSINILEEKVSQLLEIYNTLLIQNRGAIKQSIHIQLEGKSPGDINIKELLSGLTEKYLWFDGKKRQDICLINSCKDTILTLLSEISYYYSISNYYPYGLFYHTFKEYFEKSKRKLGVILIDDIGHKLSQYIKQETVPEIYYHLGDRLYHFLIDEFQDTSPVQWQNLLPLIEEALSCGGSLFVVGDTKQAIYMFRDADYKIMKEMQDKIISHNDNHPLLRIVQDNAKIEELSTNYRSGEIILDYVADIFKNKLKNTEILEDDASGLTSYNQLPCAEKKGKGYVKTIKVNKEKEEEPEKDILLDFISDILSRYQPRDIAVFARKREEVGKITAWLTEKGIPAAPYSALDIRKRKIIREVVSLLQFLASPIDDLSFATFILGDIFLHLTKINKEEILEFLFKMRCESADDYLYILFKERNKFKQIWDDFLEDIFNQVGYLPLYDLVVLIFRKFKIFDNFPDETAHTIKFLEAIHNLQIKGKNNIRDVFPAVEDVEGEAGLFNILLPDYIDAVKVMTFHLSKGLDFPVVINVIYDSAPPPEAMYFRTEDKKLKPYYITKDLMKFSSLLSDIYQKEKLSEKIQNLNTLYVINTRPKDELYNIIILTGKKSSPEVNLFE